MNSMRLISFVLPLACDTLAVAIALGLRGSGWLRPALVFSAFETAMPVFGILGGRFVGERFAFAAQTAGGIVLLAVGLHAWREALENDDAATLRFDTVRGAALAGIAISTDELAVGFPLGAAYLPIATLLLTICVQTFLVTVIGIGVGRHLSARAGRLAARYSGTLAAVAFCALGIWLLVEALRVAKRA